MSCICRPLSCPCCSVGHSPPPFLLTCRFAHQYLPMWWGIHAECASSPHVITLWACSAGKRRVSPPVLCLTRAARGRTTNLPRVPTSTGWTWTTSSAAVQLVGSQQLNVNTCPRVRNTVKFLIVRFILAPRFFRN